MYRELTGIVLLSALLLIVAVHESAADPTPPGLLPLIELLGQVDDPAVHADVLRGIQEELKGRRQVTMPEGWPAVYRKLAGSSSAAVRAQALRLSVVFGDAQALAALRKVVMNTAAEVSARQDAIQTLVEIRDADLVPMLHRLIEEAALRRPALRALAAYDDATTPKVILTCYANFSAEEKTDAVQTLAARPAYALALLEAVEQDRIPRRDLSVFTVRQMMALNNKAINDKLSSVWGTIRPASQEKAALMTKYKSLLTPERVKNANTTSGRQVFARTCATCHRLFGEGGDIGPELTGSQRHNLDYILAKVLDPAAVVPAEFRMTLIATKNGRTLTGIIKQEDDKTVTVQTQNEKVIIPKDEIESREKSSLSMMPDGLLASLKEEEVCDLIVYLGSPVQVPMAAPGGTDKPVLQQGGK